MITAHWLSYAGDAAILPISVSAFSSACPEARLVIVDDGNNPCPETTCRICENMGAEWRVSTWPRFRNLNGQECIYGILSEMNSGRETDICLKLDCDTFVASAEWLQRWLGDGMLGAGEGNGAFGCCYALRGSTVKVLMESFSGSPAEQYAPEDIAISRRLLELGGFMDHIPMKLPWTDEYGNGPNGIFIAWNPNYPDPALYIPRYSVINCGNPGVNKRKAMESLVYRCAIPN